MCRFTRQEFIQGCKAMNVDSIKVKKNPMRHMVLSRVCVKYLGQKNSTNKNNDKKMEFLIDNSF